MASLKDMRVRIAATKATQKITKAMQMVAASKLRRAQTAAEAARPFAERMDVVLANIAGGVARQRIRAARCWPGPAATTSTCSSSAPPNAAYAARSIRRSCGSRASARTRSPAEGKQVKFFCVGRKGFEQLRRTVRAADRRGRRIARRQDARLRAGAA